MGKRASRLLGWHKLPLLSPLDHYLFATCYFQMLKHIYGYIVMTFNSDKLQTGGNVMCGDGVKCQPTIMNYIV